MTSNYADSTSNVSTKNKTGDYIQVDQYNSHINRVPRSSLLKLSVAPSQQKYFSIAPGFEQRLDNYRIPPSSRSPVMLDSTGSCRNMTLAPSASNACTISNNNASDYLALANSYRLHST